MEHKVQVLLTKFVNYNMMDLLTIKVINQEYKEKLTIIIFKFEELQMYSPIIKLTNLFILSNFINFFLSFFNLNIF